MKKLLLVLCLTIFWGSNIFAQQPNGKMVGFGIMVGDPTGITAKFWTNDINAVDVDLGASYFGSPRINVDYLWHFDTFDSRLGNLYAGIGGAVGFGKGNGFYYKDKYIRTSGNAGLGARGVFGVDIVPRRTPLEIFLEFGVLVAVVPDFGSSADVALGMRFYP